MYYVKDLFEKFHFILGLTLVTSKEGLSRSIVIPEVRRPGLSLSGYLKDYESEGILIFGNVEISYFKDLDKVIRYERLKDIITDQTPAVIVAGKYSPPKELIVYCEKRCIPLFQTNKKTTDLLTQMTILLSEEFSPETTYQGTLVDVFGVGLLIQGDSSIGKSEAALGLIEKGHRLVSDDVVKMRLREGTYLEGSSPEITRHLIELRGIGIINVAHIYGAVSVRDEKRVDVIVKLEEWNAKRFYDRVGLDVKFQEILGVKIPYHIVPVKPGRDIVLLIETIVLNHQLKEEMGYNSAKEFNIKLLQEIAKKQGKGKHNREAIAKN